MDPHITERVGESIGLCVVNQIHGLTEADWGRIPKQGGRAAQPTLDFEVASDGQTAIQVETKGCSTNDNSKKTSAVSNHKSNIVQKKTRSLSKQANQTAVPVVRYGTIAVLDSTPHSIARCLILDPPPEEQNPAAARVKLLNRLGFLWNWISFISPRSTLAAALATRLSDLSVLQDPWELDGLPLRKGNGEPFNVTPRLFSLAQSNFFANKSTVVDGPAGGVVIQLSLTRLFFLGLRENTIELVAKQTFRDITEYRAETGAVRKVVGCMFSEARFSRLQLPASVRERTERRGAYFYLPVEGDLFYSIAGTAFGELPLDEESAPVTEGGFEIVQ